MIHTIKRRSKNDERGAALVFVALSMVALLIVAALIIDGGFGYTNRRQMQNAADAAALAGASALKNVRFSTASADSIATSVEDALGRNGSSKTDTNLYRCAMLTLSQSRMDPLPDINTLPTCTSVTTKTQVLSANYVGVYVRAGETHSTMLGGFANNQNSQTTRALAAASVQRARSADGPWTVCGNQLIGGYDFLEPDTSTANPNDFKLRAEDQLKAWYGGIPEAPSLGGSRLIDPDGSGAMPRSFPIHGKVSDGAPPGVDPRCGGLSANWKGLVEPDEIPVELDTTIDVDNGKKVGQYKYEGTLAGESKCPDSVNGIDKGNDDFGPAFDNCLISVPIFDRVLGGDRVHIAAIATFRIFYRQTGTVKYYANFVCSCLIDSGETTDDIGAGGLAAVRLLQ